MVVNLGLPEQGYQESTNGNVIFETSIIWEHISIVMPIH